MNTDPSVTYVNFDDPNFLVVCTPKNVILDKIPEYETVSFLSGGPFILSAFFNGTLATVVQSETPPYTPFFLLLYQQSSGIFMKSVEFPSRILGIRANSNIFFVSLENAIQAYDIGTSKALSTIDRKSTKGLFAFSQVFLAWPNDETPGKVLIAKLPEFSVVFNIQCHSGPIKSLCFSQDSKYLITASHKGTIIRVFSTETGEKVKEHRRGFTKGDIVCMDCCQDYVCVCSTQSIHLFNKEGKHLLASIDSPPLSCRLQPPNILVASENGRLSVFRSDFPEGLLEIITQHRLLPSFPIGSNRHRRITL